MHVEGVHCGQWVNHLSLYRGKLSLEDPNLDVSNLPQL